MFEKIRTLKLSKPSDHDDDAPFLKVSELHVRYDGIPALADISFELKLGEHVALVGPNGAGKSTLFKVISGVLPPTSGQVKISGESPAGHICIAYLPQSNAVNWGFPVTVRDVVMMGRVGKLGLLKWPRNKDWDFVNTCLEQVNLIDLAYRQIEELSGGQKQRMFIARALAQEAELVMMDEPLNGLDLNSQEEVFNIFELLKKQKVAVIVATHDLGLASERFDKAMLLNHKLLGYGKPDEIFSEANLKNAYGKHLQFIETKEGTMVIDDTCCP